MTELPIKKKAYFFGVKMNNWFSMDVTEQNELIKQGIADGYLTDDLQVMRGHIWNIRDTDVWHTVLPDTCSFLNFECVFMAWLGTGKRNHYELVHILDVDMLSEYIFQDDQLSHLILGDISDDQDVLDNEIETQHSKYLRIIHGGQID